MKSMRSVPQRLWVAIAAITVLLTPVLAYADETDGSDRTITVMTRNLYDGVDAEVDKLVADITAGAPPEVILVDAGAVMAGAKARDFPSRAALIAKEVASVHPDLISIQEAVLYRSQCPADFVPLNAKDVEIDFLKTLQEALENERMHYDVVAVFNDIDAEMPGLTPQGICDLRLTDYNVILARADTVKLSNVQTGRLAVDCVRAIHWPRGWISVDVKTRGQSFRFIGTHVEVEACAEAQLAQTLEIIAGPANTDLPVVLAGDFNSDANNGPMATPTYPALMAAGFVDAWTQANGNDPGYTCCQTPDLLDPVPFSLEQKRIDFILTRGGFSATNAVRTGAEVSDRTATGLWASDHAGVAATLTLP